jgi:hypothetical protein
VPAVTYRAYGRTVRIVAPDMVLATAADRLPPSYRLTDADPERTWHVDDAGTVTAAGEVLGGSSDQTVAAEILMSHLELWVAEHAARRVFVHAGCVAVDGRAIVIPGRTMSGKSSLTAALVRAGATYYSDEYAVVDARGFIRPYPRKLAIRPYDGGPNRRVPAADFGGVTGRAPVRAGLVVVLRYDATTGWAVAPLTRGQSVLHLIDNTVPARTRPRAVLTALTALTDGATALTGTRGDADEAAAHLLALLQRH